MEGSLKHVFVSARIKHAPDCHITLAVNASATPEDVDRMRAGMATLNHNVFPGQFRLGNYTQCGDNRTIQAYKCSPVHGELLPLLEDFYAKNYQHKMGHRKYPTLKLHITVDTPQKLQQFEALGNIFDVEAATLTTRALPGVAPLPPYAPEYSLPPPPPSAPPLKRPRTESAQWDCKNCSWQNNMSKKECRNPECDEWRPKAEMPKRAGDWHCRSCGDHQFASRTSCRKCGAQK